MTEQAPALHALLAARHRTLTQQALQLMDTDASPSMLQDVLELCGLVGTCIIALLLDGAGRDAPWRLWGTAALRITLCMATKVLPVLRASWMDHKPMEFRRSTLLGLTRCSTLAGLSLQGATNTDQQQLALEAVALVAAGAMAALQAALERGACFVAEGLPSQEAEVAAAVSAMLLALAANLEGGPSTWYPPGEDVMARLRLAAAAAEAAEAILRLSGFLVQNHQRLVALLGDRVIKILAAATYPSFMLLCCGYELLKPFPVIDAAAAEESHAVLAASFSTAASAAKLAQSFASLSGGQRIELCNNEADISRRAMLDLLSAALAFSGSSFNKCARPAGTAQPSCVAAKRCHRWDGAT